MPKYLKNRSKIRADSPYVVLNKELFAPPEQAGRRVLTPDPAFVDQVGAEEGPLGGRMA